MPRRQRFASPSRRPPLRAHPVRNVVAPLAFVALVVTALGAVLSGFGGRGASDLGAVLFILGGVLAIGWVLLVVLLIVRGVLRLLRRLAGRWPVRRGS